MSWKHYFLLAENWSPEWAVILGVLLAVYLILWRSSFRNRLIMFLGLALIYIMTGSPVAHLLHFGLHSISMLQHIVILMVVPLLFWLGFPYATFPLTRNLSLKKNKIVFILTAWMAGTATMWAAHFISAAKISAETGLVICGLSFQAESWITMIPQWLIFCIMLAAGILFLCPVFSRDRRLKLKPLTAVVYLFSACVSCSILGLYVAFTASNATPVIAHPESPWVMTLRADQELAGLLMWVPGCVLYVLTSINICIKWLDGEKIGSSRQTPITSAAPPYLNESEVLHLITARSKKGTLNQNYILRKKKALFRYFSAFIQRS